MKSESVDKKFYVYALLDGRKPKPIIIGGFKVTHEPFYIGKGQGDRALHHVNAILNGRNGTNAFKGNKIRSILRQGSQVLEVILDESLTERKAHAKEIEYIATIGRTPLGPLTNLTDGGDGVSGLVHSQETIDKIRKIKSGTVMPEGFVEKRAQSMRSRPLTEKLKTSEKRSASMLAYHESLDQDTKAKIGRKVSRSKQGHEVSEETRKKISEALKGRTLSEDHKASMRGRVTSKNVRAKLSAANMGHEVSEETRKKISAGHLGKIVSEETKAKMRANAKKLAKKRKLEGYVYNLSNLPPWKSGNASEASKGVWKLARHVYRHYIKVGELTSASVKTLLQKVGELDTYSGYAISSIIKKLENGWNPNEDPEWKEFIRNY